MTVAEVRKLVAAIKKDARSDDELAHSNEDSLHQAVLVSIAEGAPDAAALAATALQTTKIKFSRWCA